ncbi:hypothetical protein CVT25_000869 [Psilocybe cyanescens]|uniref:Uncharacterized protein n=1 Tax=Psilocybe cyanescens TaxID=93625 RepID=A0A409VTG0_PSICY|nr:hypothetical protein CVT25_000869 [Psilocybe cyanescens]
MSDGRIFEEDATYREADGYEYNQNLDGRFQDFLAPQEQTPYAIYNVNKDDAHPQHAEGNLLESLVIRPMGCIGPDGDGKRFI